MFSVSHLQQTGTKHRFLCPDADTVMSHLRHTLKKQKTVKQDELVGLVSQLKNADFPTAYSIYQDQTVSLIISPIKSDLVIETGVTGLDLEKLDVNINRFTVERSFTSVGFKTFLACKTVRFLAIEQPDSVFFESLFGRVDDKGNCTSAKALEAIRRLNKIQVTGSFRFLQKLGPNLQSLTSLTELVIFRSISAEPEEFVSMISTILDNLPTSLKLLTLPICDDPELRDAFSRACKRLLNLETIHVQWRGVSPVHVPPKLQQLFTSLRFTCGIAIRVYPGGVCIEDSFTMSGRLQVLLVILSPARVSTIARLNGDLRRLLATLLEGMRPYDRFLKYFMNPHEEAD